MSYKNGKPRTAKEKVFAWMNHWETESRIENLSQQLNQSSVMRDAFEALLRTKIPELSGADVCYNLLLWLREEQK